MNPSAVALRSGAAVGLVALLVLAGAPARGQPATAGGSPPDSPLAVLVDQLTALFPKVDGEVIEAEGGAVTISVGRREGLQPGVELELYRQGRELRHPRTGEILGRTEKTLGRLSVGEVFEAYATGSVPAGTDARPGDRVRISAGKIKLTLLALRSEVKENLVEAAVQELAEELTRTGRFQVAMGDQVAVWLAQEGIKGEEVLAGKGVVEAAGRFEARSLLALHFTRVQGKPYMEVRLFSFPGRAPVLTTALFVPSSIKTAPRGQQFSSAPGGPAAPTPRPRKRSLLARILGGELEAGTYSSGEASIPLREVARFGFPVVALDVAVSPRDRVPRLALTDGETIYLYRLADRALEAEWTYSARSIGRVVSLQLADLDGDGVFEVVANRYHPEPSIGLHSFILTTRGGKAVPLVQDVAMILLAVDATGQGVKQTLWGQPFTPDGFFAKGRVSRFALRNGQLVADGVAHVPADFRATGATLSNIGGKGRYLAFIDESSRFQIAFEGQENWRSSTAVGGGGHLRMELVKHDQRGGRSVFYNMEPMPLAVDLDGDGVEEIVVPQNQVPGMLAVVFRGPAGYRLQSVNSGFEGTITGLGAIPGEDRPALIAAVVRFQNLFRTAGETQLIMATGE